MGVQAQVEVEDEVKDEKSFESDGTDIDDSHCQSLTNNLTRRERDAATKTIVGAVTASR